MSKISLFSQLLSLMLFIVSIEYGSAHECTTGPNETFIKIGEACQTTCAGLKQPCCVNYFKAPDACYCNKGFARRNSDNQCIEIDSSECQQQVLPENPQNCDARPAADRF